MSTHPDRYCPVFGNYPKEYNRAVHGPYYPWVNYGPRDTPFKDVKLGEFRQWFARRQKTPAALIAATSRTHHWWYNNWLNSRYGTPLKGYLQLVIVMGFGSMVLCYDAYRNERTHKYHW